MLSAQKNIVVNENQPWSEPLNGLAGRLIFEIATSDSHSQIIHPKLNLRNDTKDTIYFYWCIYDAGDFEVSDALGDPISNTDFTNRSGPVGADIVTIKPGQTVSLDAYDYGYGLSTKQHLYVFNTASLQVNLVTDDYLVNYTLDCSRENLKEIKKKNSYTWDKVDLDTIWTGKINLKKVQLNLKTQ